MDLVLLARILRAIARELDPPAKAAEMPMPDDPPPNDPPGNG